MHLTAKSKTAKGKAPGSQPTKSKAPPSRRLPASEELLLYVVTGLLSLLLLIPVLRIDRADLRVPFYPQSDAAYYQGIVIRTLMTQPWYLHNPELGAPGSLELQDYPTGTDSLIYAIMKVIVLLTRDSAMTLNIYYLLTYPLVALSMLYVTRSLGLQRATAVTVAILFAFIPYHLLRTQTHIALSSYFMLPVALLIALRPRGRLGGPRSEKEQDDPMPRTRSDWTTELTGKPFLLRCLLSVVLGLTGVYYAFFYVIMLTTLAARRALRERRAGHFVIPLILAAVLSLTVYLSNLPTVVYQAKNGPNEAATDRSTVDSEMFALRLVQLVLPVEDHRIRALADKTIEYKDILAKVNAWLVNESQTAALGFVGSAGFVLLVGWLLFARGDPEKGPEAWRRVGELATVNMVMVLVGAVGGIGFLIAFTVTPMLRAHNRVSIVIGMVALLAMGAAADRLATRGQRPPWWFAAVLAAAVIAFGLFDQTSPGMVPDYDGLAATNAVQREFASRASGALPDGAKVFQLPFMSFPGTEGDVPAGYGDYDLLIPYEYSTGIHWSFPTMKGRPESAWQRDVSRLPAPGMIETLKRAGFAAIYLDRKGMSDGGAQGEAVLTEALGSPIVESADGRMLLWRLP